MVLRMIHLAKGIDDERIVRKVSVYFQVENFWMFSQNVINAGYVKTLCQCWRSAGGNTLPLKKCWDNSKFRRRFTLKALKNIHLILSYQIGQQIITMKVSKLFSCTTVFEKD